jgi:hypothetical protein
MNHCLTDDQGGPDRAHPACWVPADRATGHPGYYVHICRVPSGRRCHETGCAEPAGTHWGPHWCPQHDAERINRISRQLDQVRHDAGDLR